MILYGYLLLIKELKHATGFYKEQIKLVLFGLIVGYLGGSTNYPLMIGLDWFPPIGSPFVIAFPVVFGYAIIRHRLMGIRVLASKIYVTIFIALFFYTLFYMVAYIDIAVLGGLYSPLTLIVGVPIAIIVGAIFIPFLNYVEKSSDIIFFRGHNPRTIIKDLSMRIGSVIELRQLVEILAYELKKILGTDEISLVFITQKKSAKSKQTVWVSVAEGNTIKEVEIKATNPIYETVLRKTETIVREELDERKHKKLIKELDMRKAKVIAPMAVRKKVVGVILLGEKITQGAYTREDIEFLEIISAQAAVAIENARLYSEVKEFNLRLKKEIERATSDLQFANEELHDMNEKLTRAYGKLHKLDRAKSEFLSIASHQLRTPLTSIKGFTSLLLEGTYGNISKNVRSTLEKVYISNERLIKLVEDLLNISRIESGKIAFEFNKDDIGSLLVEVLDSMKIAAKNKKLKLIYKPSKTKIKPFNFDRGKLREVISNLVDNSIKYTKKGSITIQVENENDIVRIIISDTGIGITKGELEYIFDRFQRGKDINQVHTEGIGLGLYVCKKIVTAHEGKLWAESEGISKGSKFTLELKKNFKGLPGKQVGKK